ncbi:MAG TPA: hypothetical protein VE997_01200 [Candidatus Limnocylindria bacterium]|jgi:hypothetical protein|nr:hypothetical protein [Candidatus Limnocylindria bacterium]
MSYAVENALFQWEEGERRLREAPEPARSDLERAVRAVLEELRRRLGSSFSVDELADFYARDVDWASALAQREAAGTDSPWVVDAAFSRYAREAVNYAGGRTRQVARRADEPPR